MVNVELWHWKIFELVFECSQIVVWAQVEATLFPLEGQQVHMVVPPSLVVKNLVSPGEPKRSEPEL